MSVRFSRVTLTSGGTTTSFLVGGSPKSQTDLHGWIAFESFMKSVPKGETVNAHAETFLYGGEEPVDATLEEVAYFYKRIEMRPDFIEKRTEKCAETDLIITKK